MSKQFLSPDEQPYPLPDGWRWVTLNSVAEVIMGQSPSGDETTADSSYTPLIGGAADMGDLFPLTTRYTKKPTKLSEKDDVIICIRATLGKPIFSDGEYCLGRGVAALRPRLVIKNFLRYALINFEQYFCEKATGSTFSQVSSTTLKNFPVPLPPLDEQQRIIDLLDELFDKLDEAKTLAQSVVDGSERRRAAILHKTFTGELTKLWRDEHGITLDSWQKKKLCEISFTKAGYAFNSKKFSSDGEYQVIRMGNLYNDILDLSKSPVYYSKADLSDSILKRTLIHPNDILITLTGTKYKRDYGYAVCIENPQNLLVNQRILCITPEKIIAKYLLYYLKSNTFRDIFFSKETGGVNQGNVSSRFVENILIHVPPLEEQKEIVRLLDDLLSREQRTKDLAGKILDRIELLKKSILARAFRGEII